MENLLSLFGNPFYVVGLTLFCLISSVFISRKVNQEWTMIFLVFPIIFSFLNIGEINRVDEYQSLFLYVTENNVWLKLITLGVVIICLTILSHLQASLNTSLSKEVSFMLLSMIIVVVFSTISVNHFSAFYPKNSWQILTSIVIVFISAVSTILLIIWTLCICSWDSSVQDNSIVKELCLALFTSFLVYFIAVV